MKVGKFKVPEKMLRSKKIDDKFYLRVMFEKVIIMKTEYLKEEDMMEYQAICDEFDEIQESQEIPSYDVFIKKPLNRAYFKRNAC